MIRVLLFLCILIAVALGLTWLVERPGDIVLNWQGYRIETSVGVGLAVVVGGAIVVAILWGLLRFIFRIPSIMSLASKARRRNKGFAALSRGMIAAGSGDVRLANKASKDVAKHLPNEPLALLLKAQTAQLSGDRSAAEAAFAEMVDKPETRLLGLRGLHMEARRRGDEDSAYHHALEAHRTAALPWAGAAVLEHQAVNSQWEKALSTLESNVSGKLVDKAEATRLRAVLETAIAQDKLTSQPEEALRLARLAVNHAPELVPAAVLAGRLLSRKGDLRKATRIIEKAWTASPHPELAEVYVDLRPGDSNADRLVRAESLARLAPGDQESLLMVAQAAMAARDFAKARKVLEPLLDAEQRPTTRTCLLMAELEELEHGATGRVREWLARASRAPRDKAWVADGIASDTWSPASPITGKLNAFVWQAPTERLSAPTEHWQPTEPVDAPQISMEAPVTTVEVAPPAPVLIEAQAETPAPPKATAQPVVFPMAAAPDDPGPPKEERQKTRFGSV